MKIKFMGTAAYEGVPSLFCKCDTCMRARALGGRNLRSRSQALVNDELLIDFNADTVWHYQKYAFDFEKICACLITHSHCDHLYPEDVEMSEAMYSNGHRIIDFYSAESGYKKLHDIQKKTNGGISARLVEAGKRFTISGEIEYSILPLRANHDERSTPVIYSITGGGKRMLYAHDTGVFYEDAWQGMESEGRYDLLSLDCTGCLGLYGDYIDGHMSLKTNLTVLERMKKQGLVDDKTVVVINHFSHNGRQVYDEMTDAAAKHGIIVAYDGLEIEF